MYKIKPESVKAFITDRGIKLPRFQRKQTWDEKKNFQLCISVFKHYPIGVCILSRDSGNNDTRWLLDGRQRKNALTLMYKDPENIYNWARKFVKFSNRDQPDELSDKFWNKINEYLEEDSLMKDETLGEEDAYEVEETDDEFVNESEEKYSSSKDGLEFLLEIIKIIHNKKNNGTGFTLPFDFGSSVEGVPYLENGENRLSSAKLKTFIDEYRTFCDYNVFEYTEYESFLKFLEDRRVSIKDSITLKKILKDRWSAILDRINILNKIDNLLTSCEIGVIEVSNLSASDSQKIFEIINSEGEKLTAVEILSAKPSWNNRIINASGKMEEAVKSLYGQMGIVRPDHIVKWDLPATLLRRVDFRMILKPFTQDKKSDFEKELTIGFQIMAGIYEGSITKNSIESLSRNTSIRWETDYESLIEDLSQMFKQIRSSDYFQYLKSWKTSIHELTSLGCALNFILVCYTLWKESGKPIGSDYAAKKFIKKCFILWDKLIFEYVNRQWSGSMDSKISKYLERVHRDDQVFDPITNDRWMQLLTEIYENAKIGDSDIKFDLMKPLLYHFYCLSHISGPDSNYGIEVDHILPQIRFDLSQLDKKNILKDSLYNLALLPKNENVSKSDKTLRQIESDWLIHQIEKYEQIQKDKFEYFSNINNYKDLFALRKDIFDNAYGQMRQNLLNN